MQNDNDHIIIDTASFGAAVRYVAVAIVAGISALGIGAEHISRAPSTHDLDAILVQQGQTVSRLNILERRQMQSEASSSSARREIREHIQRKHPSAQTAH